MTYNPCRFPSLHEPPVPPPRRFLMGATKILQVALGRSESDEVRTNIHHLSERLKGNSGLFCTDLSKEEVGFKMLWGCSKGLGATKYLQSSCNKRNVEK